MLHVFATFSSFKLLSRFIHVDEYGSDINFNCSVFHYIMKPQYLFYLGQFHVFSFSLCFHTESCDWKPLQAAWVCAWREHTRPPKCAHCVHLGSVSTLPADRA